MNYFYFHDEFMWNIEPFWILSICLQNKWQNIELSVLWFPAEFYANLISNLIN